MVAFCTAAFLSPTEASAQHRARIAPDLASDISAGQLGSLQVIVEAPQDEVDRIAKAYGVRVVQRLALGALLEGSAGAFDVLADAFVWGSRNGGVAGDAFVWGSRNGGVTGDAFVWDSRNSGG